MRIYDSKYYILLKSLIMIFQFYSFSYAGDLKSFVRSCPNLSASTTLINDSRAEGTYQRLKAWQSLVPSLSLKRTQTATTTGRSFETNYGFSGMIQNPIILSKEISIAKLQGKLSETQARKYQMDTMFEIIQSYYEWLELTNYVKELLNWERFLERKSLPPTDESSVSTLQKSLDVVAVLYELQQIKSRLDVIEDKLKKCKEPLAVFAFPTLTNQQLQQIDKSLSSTLKIQQSICDTQTESKAKEISMIKNGWLPDLRYAYSRTLASTGKIPSDADWSMSLNFTFQLGMITKSPTTITTCDAELEKAKQIDANRDTSVLMDYQNVSHLRTVRDRMGKLLRLTKAEAEKGLIKMDKVMVLIKEFHDLNVQLYKTETNIVQNAWEIM